MRYIVVVREIRFEQFGFAGRYCRVSQEMLSIGVKLINE